MHTHRINHCTPFPPTPHPPVRIKAAPDLSVYEKSQPLPATFWSEQPSFIRPPWDVYADRIEEAA
eukprot:4869481-Karenia_brevis.AAC.1